RDRARGPLHALREAVDAVAGDGVALAAVVVELRELPETFASVRLDDDALHAAVVADVRAQRDRRTGACGNRIRRDERSAGERRPAPVSVTASSSTGRPSSSTVTLDDAGPSPATPASSIVTSTPAAAGSAIVSVDGFASRSGLAMRRPGPATRVTVVEGGGS